jgi:GGDEF domain-containing protein
MLPGPPRRRRARPVADAPIDGLLAQSEELTKGWLLALLERAPLDDAPKILAGDLTRDGPRICEAMLRAIADDTDQRRLEPEGALAPLAARAGELAGAAGAEATAQAVDALQAVLWAALRHELRGGDPDLVSELAERLAQVAELVRAAALRYADETRGPGATRPGLTSVPPSGPERGPRAPGFDQPEPPPPVAGRAPILDPPRQRAWGGAETTGPGPEALWIGALQEEIHRSAGSPLSLLLAELEDADRVRAVEGGDGSAATFSEFAQAVRGVVRRQDILVCETEARAWIIARDTGRAGAQALGSRVTVAVREAQPWRGAPMMASVGVAVLGEDGLTPTELIEAAEEARFAAAAAGIDIARSTREDSPADA